MMNEAKQKELRDQAIEVVSDIYDPEIPISIFELGLIYDLHIDPNGVAHVEMTLTTPACPVAESLPMEVQEKISAIVGITDVDLRLVWDPPWSKDRMSDEAKLALNMF